MSPGQGRIHVLGHTEEWTVFGVKGLMPVSNVSSSLFLELEFSVLLGHLAWDRSALAVVVDRHSLRGFVVFSWSFPPYCACSLPVPTHDQGCWMLDGPWIQPDLQGEPSRALWDIRLLCWLSWGASPKIYWMHGHPQPAAGHLWASLALWVQDLEQNTSPLSQGSKDLPWGNALTLSFEPFSLSQDQGELTWVCRPHSVSE